ncbi:cysteine--1-D-myo-inosityl 2-amino-2-deoxy-alpha-D-glucopyranoside ligase [Calidifontibacter terrae]
MKTWPETEVPQLAHTAPPLQLRHRQTGELREVAVENGQARMYVCGITPYDTTHLGHAATYVTFDLALRAFRNAGHDVLYVQNTTDVDDPLLERAERDGIDWRDLARREIDLFHEDMGALRNVAPQHYVGVVETMPRHIAVINQLLEAGVAYGIPVDESDAGASGVQDFYLDLSTQPTFGQESGWTREQMLEVFAERGGDPDRTGKKDELDPLLWRGQRVGEPSWDGLALGHGRPGWHLECTTIALDHLGMGFTLQGGGTDLIFPHHEMSAVQATALTGSTPFAQHYAHQAMVAYDGEKMSKSKGNLVKVSQLRAAGVDPMVIRLAVLAHHYGTDWEYTDEVLEAAQQRADSWRAALAVAGDSAAETVVPQLLSTIAEDLGSPQALMLIDQWAQSAPTDAGPSPLISAALDAALGLAL